MVPGIKYRRVKICVRIPHSLFGPQAPGQPRRQSLRRSLSTLRLRTSPTRLVPSALWVRRLIG